jgi:hypothetical protein
LVLPPYCILRTSIQYYIPFIVHHFRDTCPDLRGYILEHL